MDFKMKMAVMFPLVVWAWIMHYMDVTYNIMPVLYPNGLHVTIWDPLCIVFIGGLLYWNVKRMYLAHPPYPLKDPRLKEAVTWHEEPEPTVATPVGGAH